MEGAVGAHASGAGLFRARACRDGRRSLDISFPYKRTVSTDFHVGRKMESTGKEVAAVVGVDMQLWLTLVVPGSDRSARRLALGQPLFSSE